MINGQTEWRKMNTLKAFFWPNAINCQAKENGRRMSRRIPFSKGQQKGVHKMGVNWPDNGIGYISINSFL